MKLHKIILPVVASTMLLTGCDDQKMEWATPDGHGAVTASEIPLQVKEVLANYETLKTYSAEYMPNTTLGLGIGAAIFTDESDPRSALAKSNYQMITLGNAMKHDAMVKNDGSLNFATVDAVIAALPSDMRLYGHNFFWHTQQNQTYLKSLIAPSFTVQTDGDIASVLKNGSFDADLSSWMGWGGSSTREWDATGGVGGSGAAKITNPASGNLWDVQFCQDLDAPAAPGTYMLRFKARTNGVGHIQVCLQQPSGSYSAVGYETFEVGTEWTTCEKEITVTEDGNSYIRLCINTGADVATYWVDDVEFGTKIEDPMINIITGDNNDFEGGTKGNWSSWGNGSSTDVVEGGYNGSKYCATLVNPEDANEWSAQFCLDLADPLVKGKTYIFQFYAKSSVGSGKIQVCAQQPSGSYPAEGYNTFDVGTDWILCEREFTVTGDNELTRLCINFGKVAATYWVDNIKFGEKRENASAAPSHGPRKATKIVYTFKTAEEKSAILTDAMESWVKGMAEHLAEKNIVPYGYDVINEAIADGSNKVRGVDNVFGMTGDSDPVENATEGLNLNWESGHFYWGYFVKDYGVKAFQLARKYLPAETKLFINDYNLETSPQKLAALIDWVKSIDQANGSPIVDGIGTQMHIAINPTDNADNNAAIVANLKEKVDAQFQTMAATGKLVRVTELDVDMCSYDANGERTATSSPSAAQYKCQADVYRMIFESYKANVPEAQQSGITIWSLTDQADEHEYWLKGGKPNLFDDANLRKWAYKGVCDGIAGEDLGLKFGGEDYKKYYEENNVSPTVQ